MDSFSGGALMDGLSLYIYNCIFCFRVDEYGFFLRCRRHGWTVSLYIHIIVYSVLGWMSMDSFSGGAGMDGLSLYTYICYYNVVIFR